jgi:hypothetical protein
MKQGMVLAAVAVMAFSVNMAGCAKNASEKRAVTPTVAERVKHDTVTGRVSDIGTMHVSIRDTAGETRRVRVDDHTKMDQVATGDLVKAFVTDDGYASTIQRVAP